MTTHKDLSEADKLAMALSWANKCTRAIFDNPDAMAAGDLVDIAIKTYAISLLNFFVNMGVQMAKQEGVKQVEVVARCADDYLAILEDLIRPILRTIADSPDPLRLAGFGLNEEGKIVPAQMTPAYQAVVQPVPVATVKNDDPEGEEAVRVAIEAGCEVLEHRGMKFVMPPGGMPPGMTVEDFANAMLEAGALREEPDGTLIAKEEDVGKFGAMEVDSEGGSRMLEGEELKAFERKVKKHLN